VTFLGVDVESAILTGKMAERQEDADTGEWKYMVQARLLMAGGWASSQSLELQPDAMYPYGVCGIAASNLTVKAAGVLESRLGQ
jgi:hypothetical protein